MKWVPPKSSRKKDRSLASNQAGASVGSVDDPLAWLESLGEDQLKVWQETLPEDNLQVPLPIRSDGARFVSEQPLSWGLDGLQVDDPADRWVLLTILHHKAPSPAQESLVVPQEGHGGKTRRGKSGEEKPSESPSTSDTAETVSKWLQQALPGRGDDPMVAMAACGWIYGLAPLGGSLNPAQWVGTLQSILTQMDRTWESDPPESSLACWLLWSCEVPLALALQVANVRSHHRMVTDTWDRLNRQLLLSLENSDLWSESGGQHLRMMIASVLRCRWAADRLGLPAWDRKARKALERLAILSLACSDPAGRPLLMDGSTTSAEPDFWVALTNQVAHPTRMARTVARCIPETRNRLDLRMRREGRAVEVPLGLYQEANEWAVMRRDDRAKSSRVAVDFACDPMWLDVTGSSGRRVLSGLWDLRLHKDGKPLEIDHGWTHVCWFSDSDVDYLELQCEISDQCRVQRQVMLEREGGWCFLADALLADQAASWKMESLLPIGAGMEFVQNNKNHEGWISEVTDDGSLGQPRGLLLPLGLPEWKRSPSSGEVFKRGDAVVLSQQANGRRLYNPVVLALKSKHLQAPYTWRSLTIGEDLKIQPPHIAGGYRLQLGDHQWVFYRSLEQVCRRSMLGLHLTAEFYAGRFDHDEGTFDALVEVEAESA
jgi:hypothetical protein